MGDNKKEPVKKKRKRVRYITLLHTFPIKDKTSILRGDIVEIEEGVFIDVSKVYEDLMSFNGVELLDLKKVKGYSLADKKNNLMNKCLDIYTDSSRKEKKGAIALLEYLKDKYI